MDVESAVPDRAAKLTNCVPMGRAVKLILASEDVVHSFFVPALRLKHDVVPGSYQTFGLNRKSPAAITFSARITAAPAIRIWAVGCA
jgi:hypothetical protein